MNVEKTPDMTADLLRTITAFRLPDVVLVDLRGVRQRRAERQREWDRYDSGNPRSVLRQPELAKLMIRDGADEERIAEEHAESTRRCAAFIQADKRFDAVVLEEHRLREEALHHPAADRAERAQQLARAFDISRLRTRLALHLAAVSNSRKFRPRPDVLEVMHSELTARLTELEAERGFPGDKKRFTMPAPDAELVAALQGRPATKEITHAVR